MLRHERQVLDPRQVLELVTVEGNKAAGLRLVSPRTPELRPLAVGSEADQIREDVLALLGLGVGDHMPVEVQLEVARLARRLATIEPPIQSQQ